MRRAADDGAPQNLDFPGALLDRQRIRRPHVPKRVGGDLPFMVEPEKRSVRQRQLVHGHSLAFHRKVKRSAALDVQFGGARRRIHLQMKARPEVCVGGIIPIVRLHGDRAGVFGDVVKAERRPPGRKRSSRVAQGPRPRPQAELRVGPALELARNPSRAVGILLLPEVHHERLRRIFGKNGHV